MVLEILQYLSILIEAFVAIIGIVIVIRGNKFGYGLLITFAIYVFYDLANQFQLNINPDVLYSLFFIASISILWFAWGLLKNYFNNQNKTKMKNKK